MKAPSLKSYAAVHLSAFFFGMTAILGSVIQSSSYHIVFYRSFIACITFVLIGRLFFGLTGRIQLKDLKMQVIAGLLIAGHWITFFFATKMAGAALAAVSYSTFPFFLAYLEPLCFKQKPDPWKILLSLGLIVGVILISPPEFDLSNQKLLGILNGIASGFLFAVVSLLYRMRKSNQPNLTLLFWQMFFSALFTFPLIAASPLPAVPIDWLWLLILGGICTLGAHGLFIYSLKEISAQTAGMAVSLEGVYAMAMSILILKESISFKMLIGTVIILGISIGTGFYDRVKSKRFMGKP